MSASKTWSESILFQSFWDDGLLDLLAGLALLLAGLGWQTRLGALAVMQAPLWVALWLPLRRTLVDSRAGYVKFSLQRRRSNARSLAVALLLGLACLALIALGLAWLPGQQVEAGRWAPVAGLPALIVAGGTAVAAVLTGAKRFYLYGLLIIALAVITVAFAWEPGWPIAGGGGVMTACGAWLLFRFLRDSRAFTGNP